MCLGLMASHKVNSIDYGLLKTLCKHWNVVDNKTGDKLSSCSRLARQNNWMCDV